MQMDLIPGLSKTEIINDEMLHKQLTLERKFE